MFSSFAFVSGYKVLSRSNKRDLIIINFIEHKDFIQFVVLEKDLLVNYDGLYFTGLGTVRIS